MKGIILEPKSPFNLNQRGCQGWGEGVRFSLQNRYPSGVEEKPRRQGPFLLSRSPVVNRRMRSIELQRVQMFNLLESLDFRGKSWKPLRFFLLLTITLWGRSFSGAADLAFETRFPSDFPTLDRFSFKELGGETVAGEDLLGQAVAIVVMLPTCPKCTSKLGDLEETRQVFEEEGITIVAVSTQSDSGSLQRLADSRGYDWMWCSNGSEIRKQLGSSRTFEVFLFDRLGQIAFQFKQTDASWDKHLRLGLGAVCERALDLTEMSHGYAGAQVCGMCHKPEYEQWVATPHAGSYDTLRKTLSHQKLECVGCHVTGEAGKESRPWRLTPKEMQAVGCEECHGPGGPHRTKPHPDASLHSYEESSCVRCHDEANSPNWNYEEYLRQVVHIPAKDILSATGTEPKAAVN